MTTVTYPDITLTTKDSEHEKPNTNISKTEITMNSEETTET